jgi:hypothetical protein
MECDNATNVDRKSGTWEDNDLFPLLSLDGSASLPAANNCHRRSIIPAASRFGYGKTMVGLRPSLSVPRTLGRTWGTRPALPSAAWRYMTLFSIRVP